MSPFSKLFKNLALENSVAYHKSVPSGPAMLQRDSENCCHSQPHSWAILESGRSCCITQNGMKEGLNANHLTSRDGGSFYHITTRTGRWERTCCQVVRIVHVCDIQTARTSQTYRIRQAKSTNSLHASQQ